nr:MAG TPA: hypothetical protein [Caudoviricetes sp.]
MRIFKSIPRIVILTVLICSSIVTFPFYYSPCETIHQDFKTISET